MVSNSGRSRVWRSLITAGLAMSLGDCGLSSGEKSAISTFSGSVSGFGAVATAQLPAMRDGSVAMTMTSYTADPKRTWPNTSKFSTADYETILYGQFTPERVAERQLAITALTSYGAALTALAGYDSSQSLTASSTALATAIKGLPAKDKVITDANAGILGNLVQQLGGLLVEHQKAQLVRQIVPIYQPQVDKLCLLLADDFDPSGSNLGKEYQNQSATLRQHEIDRLDSGGQSVGVRLQALPALQLADNNYQRARQILPGIADAGRKCATAGESLVKAVADPNYSVDDIYAFAQAVQKLVQTAEGWK